MLITIHLCRRCNVLFAETNKGRPTPLGENEPTSRSLSTCHPHLGHVDTFFFTFLYALAVGIDKHSLVVLLGMQSLPLLEHDETYTRSDCHDQHYQSCNNTHQTVGGNEADDGSSCRGCCPIDIPPLYSHEFKGLLESLEQWVIGVADFLLFSCHSSRRFSLTEYARNNSHSLVGHTEEQWQCLCCCHEEDTCSYNHHDLFLEILLITRNILIVSIN